MYGSDHRQSARLSVALRGCSAAMTADLQRDFRHAMRKLAATVSLVTTAEEGVRHGMQATAISSLSLDPPSLMAYINRWASMHGPASRVRYFCVNLLSAEQAALCGRFGSCAGGDRFEIGEWRAGPHDLPYLPDAAAALFCEVDHMFDYGTRTVFVGRMERVDVRDAADPLLYLAGAMGGFRQEQAA